MNHFLTLFLVPESSLPQATLTSPPANEQPVSGANKLRATPVKFIASVAANAARGGVVAADPNLFPVLFTGANWFQEQKHKDGTLLFGTSGSTQFPYLLGDPDDTPGEPRDLNSDGSVIVEHRASDPSWAAGIRALR